MKNFLYKLIFFKICIYALKIKKQDLTNEDDMNSMALAANLANNLYSGEHTNLLSDKYYNNVKQEDILMNTAMLLSDGNKSIQASHKLNGIMNKVNGGEDEIKNNQIVKNTLRVILNNPMMKMPTKVAAAKLSARISNLPVSLQTTELNPSKAPKDLSSYIIMPRKERIYRPDYVAENFKAGNWELNTIY
jgi:hypothetical protein